MALRVLFLGAGGTGGYFGARLAQAKSANVAFLVRAQRAEFLRTSGLVVQTPKERFVVKDVRTVTDAASVGSVDVVVLSCKAYDLDSAMQAIAPAMTANPSALVLPLLNGVKHFDRLDETFGKDKVLGGCVYINAELDAHGVVHQQSPLHRMCFGVRQGNAAHARGVLARLDEALKATPCESLFSDNVMQDVWEKYVFIAVMAGMTCLIRAPLGTIASTPEGRELMLRFADECNLTAKLEGFPLRAKALQTNTERLVDVKSKMTASMLKDLVAGKPIESDQLVGDMLARLRRRAPETSAVMLQTALCHLDAYNLSRPKL